MVWNHYKRPGECFLQAENGIKTLADIFLSEKFDTTQPGWKLFIKEAIEVMNTLEKMHWVVCTSEVFELYMDHNKFIFLFGQLAVVPDLSQTSLRKVLRWYFKLSIYSNT